MEALEVLQILEWHTIQKEQRLNAKKSFLNIRGHSWDKLNNLSEDEIINLVNKEGTEDFIKWADNIISYITGEDDFSLFVPSGWIRLFERYQKWYSEDILKIVCLFNDICEGYSIGETESKYISNESGDRFIGKEYDLNEVLMRIQAFKATPLDVLWAAYLAAKGDEE
jgi:hypothetical protein